MNVLQQPGANLPYGTVQGDPLSDGKTFFGFHLFWQEDFAKISEVPGTPHNVDPARSIT